MNADVVREDIVKHNVFIIDDHAILRDGITQLINQQDDLSVCGEAGDVSQALEGIKDCQPEIAIVDISLGESSGLHLIEDLTRRYPDLLILTLSMHDEAIYAERCLKAGAKGYIMKHEPSRRVLEALRTVLHGEIYVSEKLGKSILHNKLSGNIGYNKSSVELLSNRELEVFELMGRGLKTKEIAEQFNLSVKTINTYILHIKQKMELNNIREVITSAAQWVTKL
jgi:DNA-binding NarL/FixJ family response regulator